MKNLATLITFCLFSTFIFAKSGEPTKPIKKKKSVVSNFTPSKKAKLLCAVSITKTGNAAGIDCNGVLYSDGVGGSCTKADEVCETAFIAANACSSTALSDNIAARHAYHQNKCNPPEEIE